MDLERLAQMVAKAQDDKGISDYALEHEIGRPGGKAFNAKQLKRWKDGERIQAIPRVVVLRLIEILDLPPYETAELAGVFPPNVTADMLRRLELVTTTPNAVSPGSVALPVSSELGQLIRRNRRRGDRRHLRLVKPVAA